MKRVANMLNSKKTSFWLLGLLLTCASCSDPKEFVYNDDDYNTEEKVVVNVTDPNGEEEAITAGTKMAAYVMGEDGTYELVEVVVGQDGSFVLPTSAQQIVAYSPIQEEWGIEAMTEPQLFSVQSDQTTEENYEESDLMIGTLGLMRSTTQNMQFTHKLAKIVIHIMDETGANDFEQCGITLRDMNNTVWVDLSKQAITTVEDAVADIKMLAYSVTDHRISLRAIVAPQTKLAGDQFIVFINGEHGIRYSIPQDAELQGGKTYSFSMRLTESGLVYEGSSISDWKDEGENELDIKVTE
mgnify:FL=1